MQKRRRPRALTLTLPNESQPYLVWNEKKYTLRNFSEHGIGLWVQSPAPLQLSAGTEMSADIVIESQIYPVRLEIRHSSPGVLGLEFTEISEDLRRTFRKLLEPSQYAGELRPHRKTGTSDSEGHPRLWYSGAGGAELLVWYHGLQRMILRLQLSWLGRWVLREQYRPAQTGYLSDDAATASGKRILPDSLLVRHEQPDPELLQEAAQFLTSVPLPLPGALFWQFLETGEDILLPEELITQSQVA